MSGSTTAQIATANPDNPPPATTVEAGFQTAFILPRASITVLRGKVAAFKD
jgi:hypothetical protein